MRKFKQRYSMFFIFVAMFFILNSSEEFYGNNRLITVMGASCSGKSTLSKELLQHLGSEWRFVGLDEIEDEFKLKKIAFTDDELINAVIDCANQNLANGYSVVIDTNMYNHKFMDIGCNDKLSIFVYSPLKVLLERNTARDKELLRSAQGAYYAQKYVLKTFSNFEKNLSYDLKIDSSLLSVDESVEKIIAFISGK